jgi:hypothetical protein
MNSVSPGDDHPRVRASASSGPDWRIEDRDSIVVTLQDARPGSVLRLLDGWFTDPAPPGEEPKLLVDKRDDLKRRYQHLGPDNDWSVSLSLDELNSARTELRVWLRPVDSSDARAYGEEILRQVGMRWVMTYLPVAQWNVPEISPSSAECVMGSAPQEHASEHTAPFGTVAMPGHWSDSRRVAPVGTPPGWGAFESPENAEERIGGTVRALVAEGTRPTQSNVVLRLRADRLTKEEITVRALRYWVIDTLGYSWRDFCDQHK